MFNFDNYVNKTLVDEFSWDLLDPHFDGIPSLNIVMNCSYIKKSRIWMTCDEIESSTRNNNLHAH